MLSGMFSSEYIVNMWIYIKHQLYLLGQHSESFKIWSAIIRINTDGKCLIMELGPGHVNYWLSILCYKPNKKRLRTRIP